MGQRENGGKRRESHFTAEMERENMGKKEKGRGNYEALMMLLFYSVSHFLR